METFTRDFGHRILFPSASQRALVRERGGPSQMLRKSLVNHSAEDLHGTVSFHPIALWNRCNYIYFCK
jgi:hypothetical protein